MSCFEVQVLEPSIHTIEIETCVNGQVTSLDVVQYDIASLEVTHCVALLPSDYDTIVSGIVPVWNILGGTGIYVSSQSGIYTVNASGLQPSGNYSLVGHNHTSSDITNFNSSVSGLLPVKNILSGSGIEVSELNGVFTVGVTGTFGLTSEEVDDRVSNLLSAGQNILLNYDDSGNLLTISAVGLQPSGDYSLIGHNHNSSDILDFITAVSGLLPNIYDAALPWTPNHTLVDGTRYLVNDLVYENGRLYRANYENESIPVSNDTYWTDVGPGYRLNIDGRDIPNIPYPVTSVNGYTNAVELSTTDLDDFTSAVSGLIPPSNFSSLTGTSGVVVSTSGTHYFIGLLNPSIELSYITDLSNEGRSFLLDPSSNNLQTLITDETGSGLLVFNTSPAFSGIPTVPTATSGTNSTQIANTAFVRTEISNLVNSAPSTLDTLNELATALGNDANFATTVASGLGQKANIVHTHSSSDITNFDSSVSGLLPVKNILGSGYVNVASNSGTYTVSVSGLQPSGNYSFVGHSHSYTDITNWASGIESEVSTLLVAGNYITIDYDSFADTLTINTSGLQPSGNYSLIGHSHNSSDINDFNSSVSGLLPSVSGSGYVVSSFHNNVYTISVTGLQPSGNYSLVGHTHTTNDITDFDASVSGLLPVKDIVGGSGISVTSTSGIYTIDANITGVILEEIQDNLGNSFLVAGNNIDLDYVDASGTLTINTVTDPTFDKIQLDLNAAPVLTQGQIGWNDTEGTIDIALTDDVTINIGEHSVYRVRNETGSVLYKGQVVYASGVHPNGIIEPNLYVADGTIREIRFIGLILENINDNNNGYAMNFGHISNIDTRGNVASPFAVGDETWITGDILYVHPTVPGKLTNIEPKHSIITAIILDAANNGKIFVRPTSYGHLSDNHDVAIIGATNGQFLQYNSSTDYWVPSSSGNFSVLNVNNTGVVVSSGGTSGYLSKFTNANSLADSLIYDNGTNVGIGTSTPSSRFHVIGSGIFSSGIIVGDNNTNGYVIGPSGNTYIKFNNSSNNWINIGSNSYTNSSTYLETQFTYLNGQSTYVNGTLQFPAAGNNPTSTATQQDSNTIRIFNKLWNGSGVVSPGNDIVSKASTTTNLESRLAFLMHNGDGTQNRTERLSILSNGNIGIGTSAPSGRLDIAGDVYVRGTGNSLGTIYVKTGTGIPDTNCKVRGDANGNLFLDAGAASVRVGNQDGALVLNASNNPITIGHGYNANSSAQTILFRPAGTERVRIDASGNVGVGTTTPSGLLDIAGNLTFNTFTEKVITNTNSGSGISLSIDSGTVHRITLTDNCSFTMPSAVAGKSFSMFLNTGSGNYTASFSGVLWSDSAPPTITTTANKVDILSFISDGSYWYGSYSQNYGQ